MPDSNPGGGGWRYQPVYRDDAAGRAITLCECYFDAQDRLEGWSEDPAMHPQGETMEELSRDLSQMLADTYKWQPVAFNDLHVGMRFEATGVDVERMIAAMEATEKPIAMTDSNPVSQTTCLPRSIVVDLARELYDRFVMGGWEPQDAYKLIEDILNPVFETAPKDNTIIDLWEIEDDLGGY